MNVTEALHSSPTALLHLCVQSALRVAQRSFYFAHPSPLASQDDAIDVDREKI